MALLQEAEGRGQQCHRVIHSTEGVIFLTEHGTERYEIVVLLSNSDLTKGNNKRAYSSFTTKTMAGGLFKLPITSFFVVKT